MTTTTIFSSFGESFHFSSHPSDIDECQIQQSVCHKNSICLNTIGAYNCTCNTGYYGNGFDCQDIDECSQEKQICAHDAVCINTIGSFLCSCKEGFIENGTSCEDMNECVHNTTCHVHAQCLNTRGSFKCLCKNGFHGLSLIHI